MSKFTVELSQDDCTISVRFIGRMPEHLRGKGHIWRNEDFIFRSDSYPELLYDGNSLNFPGRFEAYDDCKAEFTFLDLSWASACYESLEAALKEWAADYQKGAAS